MQCPGCQEERPAGEQFCGNCGRAIERERRAERSSLLLQRSQQVELRGVSAAPGPPPVAEDWEYMQLTVPLDLEVPKGGIESAEFTGRFDYLVQQQLQRLSRDGWQPDQPTRVRALKPEQIRLRKGGFLRGGDRYEAVTIRLKRSHSHRHLTPG